MDRHHDPMVVKHESHFGSVGGAGTANNHGYEIKGMRGHAIYALGEFIGTVLFLWFAFAGHLMVVNQAADGELAVSSAVIYVALAYGFSFLVTAWAFYRISGGLFNPAVSHDLCLFAQCRAVSLTVKRSPSEWSSVVRWQ